jgi:hypothetical protein
MVADATTDLDAPDKWGTTPLMYAAAMGYTEDTAYLIQCGAKLDIQDERGRTFLRYALARGHWDLVMETLDYLKVVLTAEVFQACVTHTIISALFECPVGSDLETRAKLAELYHLADDVNFTFPDPRYRAMDVNLMHFVKDLPQAQALHASGFTGWNQQDSQGNLALSSIASRGDPQIVKFCLENGTNVNHLNHEKRTALFDIAAQLQSVGLWQCWNVMDSILLFLSAGVNVFASDDCRCACSPQGCNFASVFQLEFKSHALDGRGAVPLIWTLEWSFLVEEHRDEDSARKMLLSFLRRLKCNDYDFGITHVCCHRGRPNGCVSKPSKIKDDDVSEILSEEHELIEALEAEMTALGQQSVTDLRTLWLLQLKQLHKSAIQKELELKKEYDSKRLGTQQGSDQHLVCTHEHSANHSVLMSGHLRRRD